MLQQKSKEQKRVEEQKLAKKERHKERKDNGMISVLREEFLPVLKQIFSSSDRMSSSTES